MNTITTVIGEIKQKLYTLKIRMWSGDVKVLQGGKGPKKDNLHVTEFVSSPNADCK